MATQKVKEVKNTGLAVVDNQMADPSLVAPLLLDVHKCRDFHRPLVLDILVDVQKS